MGGEIDLSNLVSIDGGTTKVLSSEVGSIVNLSSLTNFTDNGGTNSELEVKNNGEIQAGNLQSLEEVDIAADNSDLELLLLTDYIGTNLVRGDNGAEIDLRNMVNILSGTLDVVADDSGTIIYLSSSIEDSPNLNDTESNGGDIIFIDFMDDIPPTIEIQGVPSTVNNTNPFNVTFEFSEEVIGFEVTDITVVNGSVGSFVAIDGNTYTADVTPDGNGDITIDVAAGVAQDAAGNDNTAATPALVTFDDLPPTVEVTLELLDLDSIPGIVIGEEFDLKVRFQDLVNDKSVVSGYGDLEFDQGLLQVISINHDSDYPFLQTGTIENDLGIVDEVGASSFFGDPPDDTVFTLKMKALAEGNTTITSNAGESVFSEITIIGSNDDQRENTIYGDLALEIKLGQPDIVATAFDADSDHLVLGQTNVTFTLKNQGKADASSFNVDIIYSDDETIGNEDDLIVETVSITGLTEGDSLTQSIDLALPLETLKERAEAEDPSLPPIGTISNNIEYLGLIIDPEGNLDNELDSNNNLNQGKGLDKDDVTYFPWDVNGNGSVRVNDAIQVISELGNPATSSSLIDLDFNGWITPSDAIGVINHIGYQINPNVIE